MVTNLRVVPLVLLCAVLSVGCGSAATPPGASPAGSVATASPTAADPTSPAPTMTTLGHGDQVLDAGTYRMELAGAPTVLTAGFPTLQITIPDGWSQHDGWLLHRGSIAASTVAVQFWAVDQVFQHPCQWQGTLFRPGPTVGDLVAALVDRPLRNATEPVDVILDGFAGKYLEWSVPSDINFSDCDLDGATHDFESWTGPQNESDRYQQGPGQVDRLWILDVDGARLVIDAFDMPSATDAERAELVDVVESIRFER